MTSAPAVRVGKKSTRAVASTTGPSRQRLDELREVRASGDPHRLLYYLNEGLHGNMGGMGSSRMYRKTKFGTEDS
ncbi:MAG: DUF3336 domain-containing protein [Gammaproteobacteria bacterium]|nr:DUF3336 domain-containing protein [Gammaproteobacteria bacterium]